MLSPLREKLSAQTTPKPTNDSNIDSLRNVEILGSASILRAKIAENTGAKPNVNDNIPDDK